MTPSEPTSPERTAVDRRRTPRRADHRVRLTGRIGALGAALTAAVALALGCASSGDDPAAVPPDADGAAANPTAGERAICERLQSLVEEIVAGEAEGSMRALHELELAVADGEDGPLHTEGRAFFETIYGTVPDPGSLTPEESSEVGDEALRAAQPRLGAMLDGCARLGLPIEDLPTGADRP